MFPRSRSGVGLDGLRHRTGRPKSGEYGDHVSGISKAKGMRGSVGSSTSRILPIRKPGFAGVKVRRIATIV